MHSQLAPESIVEITHSAIPGRARLHIPRLYRQKKLTERLERTLASCRGVRSVSGNELTASVLLTFDHKDRADQFVEITQRALARVLHDEEADIHVDGPGPAPVGATSAPAGRWEWHAMSGDRVVSRWQTSADCGLASDVAGERLAEFGPNVLPQTEETSALKLLAAQFASLPVTLLLGSTVVSLLTGGVADAAIMMGVVLVNASIGFGTERQTRRTIKALTQTGARDALVLRDGVPRRVTIENLVPGDVLVLAAGDQIPADGRLVGVTEFSVDESPLTGESAPVKKTIARLRREIPLADRANMIYRGTVVATGRGKAVATATGADTEIGRIQSSLTDAEQPETPLQQQLRLLGNQLVFLTGAVCTGVFVVGLLRRRSVLEMLKTAVSLAVAAIPEGLPAVATTTLALTVVKMRKRNMLVRRIDAVETLGSVETICLDKTGTLTLNRMTLVEAFTHSGGHRLHGRGAVPGKFGDDPELDELAKICLLCNDAKVVQNHRGAELDGSATEKALVQFALDRGADADAIRAAHPRIKTEYRSEGRSWMSTLHEVPAAEGGGFLLAVKGRPEDVLARCQFIRTGDEIRPLSPDLKKVLARENEKLANRALRVLAGAYRRGTSARLTANQLIWTGLVGMIDPPREGVRELIGQFRAAGIKTIMVTGDQAPTAYAIARALDLSGRPEIRVLDASALEREDMASLRKLVREVDVFARVTPSHKLRIVQALQGANAVVAMTGDGINDGPALKAADVGIAMGESGTEMAREVGDIVLKDDNLLSVLAAIEQGRTTHDNVRKSIHFVLATNLSEVLVVFGAVAATGGHPLSAMQLLWINLVTDIFPALALSLEPPDPDVLKRAPLECSAPIFSRADSRVIGREAALMTLGTLSNFLYGVTRYGFGPRAQTMAFSNLITAQLLHAYFCRSETVGIFSPTPRPRNRALEASIVTGLVLQATSIFLPGVSRLLGTARLSVGDLCFSQGTAVLHFLAHEWMKYRREMAGSKTFATTKAP